MLVLTIFRGGRTEDRFTSSGSLDTRELQGKLRDWLQVRGWQRSLWGEFEMDADNGSKSVRVRL